MFSLINATFQRGKGEGEGTGVSDERLVEWEVDLNANTQTHTALLGAVVHKLTANVQSDNPTVLSSSGKRPGRKSKQLIATRI